MKITLMFLLLAATSTGAFQPTSSGAFPQYLNILYISFCFEKDPKYLTSIQLKSKCKPRAGQVYHSDVIMSQNEEMLGQIKRHSVSNIQMGWYVYLTVAVTQASGIATFSLTWVSQDSWLENIIGGSTGVIFTLGMGRNKLTSCFVASQLQWSTVN